MFVRAGGIFPPAFAPAKNCRFVLTPGGRGGTMTPNSKTGEREKYPDRELSQRAAGGGSAAEDGSGNGPGRAAESAGSARLDDKAAERASSSRRDSAPVTRAARILVRGREDGGGFGSGACTARRQSGWHRRTTSCPLGFPGDRAFLLFSSFPPFRLQRRMCGMKARIPYLRARRWRR